MAPAKTDDPAAVSWHFDKRIPIALILAIAVQTGGAIWWAAGVNAYIEDDKRSEASIVERVKAVEKGGDEAALRLVRFEVLLEGVTDQLKEQRQLLAQIRDSVGPPPKK